MCHQLNTLKESIVGYAGRFDTQLLSPAQAGEGELAEIAGSTKPPPDDPQRRLSPTNTDRT